MAPRPRLLVIVAFAMSFVPCAHADEPAVAPVRGVVRPINQAAISSDIRARITKLNRKEGEAFRRGDVIVEFDCRRHRAEYAAAEAAYREAKLAQDSQVYLQHNQAGAKFDVDVAKVRAAKGEAEAEALKVRLDQCAIIAPFDGRVAELTAFEHEIPQEGKPFLTLFDDSTLELELIVPSTWLKWLKPGSPFNFAVDETGVNLASTVLRVGAAVDPVSQTIKVVGSVASDRSVLAGMSGTAEFLGGH